MRQVLASWQFWAFGSAAFAALTAIFAKVGVSGVNSDFATLIRTCVILVVTAAIVTVTGQLQAPGSIAPRTYLFLVLDTVTGGDGERLYARLGWTRVGEIPDYALFPDGRLCSTTVFWKRAGSA